MSPTSDKDLGAKHIQAEMKRLRAATVLVGVHGDAGGYPGGMTIAGVAGINEFGATWTLSAKAAYFMARVLMEIDPDKEPGRFWGTVRKLTGRRITIPERAPIRKAIDENLPKLEEAAKRVYGMVAAGMSADEALAKFGMLVETFIKRQIDNTTDPPNAQLTQRIKGEDDPLVASGRYRNSIRYEIKH